MKWQERTGLACGCCTLTVFDHCPVASSWESLNKHKKSVVTGIHRKNQRQLAHKIWQTWKMIPYDMYINLQPHVHMTIYWVTIGWEWLGNDWVWVNSISIHCNTAYVIFCLNTMALSMFPTSRREVWLGPAVPPCSRTTTWLIMWTMMVSSAWAPANAVGGIYTWRGCPQAHSTWLLVSQHAQLRLVTCSTEREYRGSFLTASFTYTSVSEKHLRHSIQGHTHLIMPPTLLLFFIKKKLLWILFSSHFISDVVKLKVFNTSHTGISFMYNSGKRIAKALLISSQSVIASVLVVECVHASGVLISSPGFQMEDVDWLWAPTLWHWSPKSFRR